MNINQGVKFVRCRRFVAFLHDLIWVPAAIFLAFEVRLDFQIIPSRFLASFINLIVVATIIHGFSFWINGLYRGIWRFASIPDLIRIIRAVSISSVVVLSIFALSNRLSLIPRSVFLLYPLFLFSGLSFTRLLYRWLKDNRFSWRLRSGKITLIVGAGKSGELLLRELIYKEEYQPIAFLDNDPLLQGKEIHGVKVVGSDRDLVTVISAYKIGLVVVAIPGIGSPELRKIRNDCAKYEVECQLLPSLHSQNGMILDQLRPVNLEDLLGREPVNLDKEKTAKYIKGKNVLVTGGGGSIGSELCRQIVKMSPGKLIIYDHGEFNLYTIDHELKDSRKVTSIHCILGDVKDRDRMEWVFLKFKPDVIFHAAAYKHVPLLEDNPAEAVLNNVIGTKIVADFADQYCSDRFILVSTDKAVNPANVMGATKRISEIYCQNLSFNSKTKFVTTRFGNVLGSAGSVVPLFEKQIKAGGPVTVTHENIKRYFMTIPEAVILILQAGSMGNGGEIFVLEMGEPVLIKSLAEQMIQLSGLTPDIDITIEYTGLRPGEKLFEELFHEKECLSETIHPKMLLAKSRKVDWGILNSQLDSLEKCAHQRNIRSLYCDLKLLVPEYSVPANTTNEKKNVFKIE